MITKLAEELIDKYDPPYTREQIKKLYGPALARKLLHDPVHRWRSDTGIELVHQEPSLDEQLRIYKNWKLMSDAQKRFSDKKSIELFGLNNTDNHNSILKNKYNYKDAK